MSTELQAARVSLRSSFAVQWRVIHALMMREVITRFGRHNLGVLWLVGEPMLFTMGVATLWASAGLNHGSNLPIVPFAITGYSSVLMWRNTVGRCTHAIQQNINLLYHRNVQVIDVLLTRILLEIAGASGSFLVLTLIFMGIGWTSGPTDLLTLLGGWLMLAWFGTALGLTMGALTSYSHVVERLWHPAAYLLFPLSGAAFMLDWLPPSAREVLMWLPMVHGTELLREGYFGHLVRTHYDLFYMTSTCAGLTLLGLFLVRDAGRRVEPE